MFNHQQSFPTFTLNDLPLLKQRIRLIIFGAEILGSQLGGLVIKAADLIGKKLVLRDYGGLKIFAENYLSDIVLRSGIYRNSQDHIYQIIPQSSLEKSVEVPEPVATSARTPITDQNYNQFWQAFSNPTSHLLIEFNAGNNLFIRLRKLSIPSSEFQEFPSISPQEYKEIVNLFAENQLQPGQHSQAIALIDQQTDESLHYQWYKFLVEKCGLSVSNSWGRFRVERILALFETKARRQQFTEEQISHYSKLLKDSQRKQRPLQESHKAQESEKAQWPEKMPLRAIDPEQSNQDSIESSPHILLSSNSTQSPLQTLVMRVVARMTDEQLRQLMLPFGHMFDEMK